MNARELRDEAGKMRTRAKASITDAELTKVTASGYQERGSEDEARIQYDRVVQLEEEARHLEQQAQQAEEEALQKEREAANIERQQEQVKRDAQTQIDDLEKQKRNLRGGPIGLF
ncbi:MAG TPA: hypothetical protein VLG36_02620 [Candidatus Chromulinivoraceae bacterium]|nr:hypothetical protein [Candidatus Chromulinivoraceae bacterium]